MFLGRIGAGTKKPPPPYAQEKQEAGNLNVPPPMEWLWFLLPLSSCYFGKEKHMIT
jgi:hypothetical protein